PTSMVPMTFKPGTSMQVVIPYTNGPIGGVNVAFGGGSTPPTSYNQVMLPPSTMPTGMAMVGVSLKGSVCDDLANVCHQIKCYEQVKTPDGMTVSKATAQQMVLDCT